jgi:glycosyltransferase involved in cell wall biosynthesis
MARVAPRGGRENIIRLSERLGRAVIGQLHLVDEDLKSLKGAVYFQWTYRWMIDFVNELSNMLGDVRAYSRGIFGTYPWGRYRPRTYVLSARSYVPFLINFLRYRPDISILLASETSITLSIFVLAKLLKSRVVLVVEENEERTFHSLVLKVLAKLKRMVVTAEHKASDLIIAESEASKEYLLRMGCNPAIIFSLPHGVNIDDFRPERKNLELARRIGVRQDDLGKNIALFVGNYNAYKGAEFMTEAILNFRADDRLVFLIPDTGPVFLKHADELNALPNVYAYPPIDDQQMPDLYNLADIVVIPSMRCPGTSSDRSPNSLTEAMASGKAVIGTAVGGIPLIMGDAGLLIAPNDSNAIVEALSMLAADAELRKALGKKARQRAVTELSNKVYARRILELLSRV